MWTGKVGKMWNAQGKHHFEAKRGRIERSVWTWGAEMWEPDWADVNVMV